MKMGFAFDKDSIFSQVDLADAAKLPPEEHRRIGIAMMREMCDDLAPPHHPRAREMFELWAHNTLIYAPSAKVREAAADAFTVLRGERGYPQPPPGGYPWCEEFRQQALRENPHLRAFEYQRTKDSPPRRRVRRRSK
jgi:hypothetical protein